MLLFTSDIYNRIYKEIVDEITRAEADATDNDIVTMAITAAEQEARIYLSRYDLIKLFGTADDEPTTVDQFLKYLCIDIACWHLVKLGHPSVNYDTSRAAYEDAISTLKNIMKGFASPEWPYKETTGQSAPNGSAVTASYNSKRDNLY